MNGYALIRRVWDILGEDDPEFSGEWPIAKVVRALNGAMAHVASEIRKAGDGWLIAQADLTPAAGATSVALPSDFLCALRAWDTANGEVLYYDRGGVRYPRTGVRLAGNALAWDGPLAQAGAWRIEYAPMPGAVRWGTLGAQTSGTASVVLPASDSGGAAADPTGRDLSIVFGSAYGEHSVVGSWAAATRTATLETAFATAAATGNTFLLSDVLPDIWAEVWAWAAAMLLPGGLVAAGAGYDMAIQAARSAGRQALLPGTVYHEGF